MLFNAIIIQVLIYFTEISFHLLPSLKIWRQIQNFFEYINGYILLLIIILPIILLKTKFIYLLYSLPLYYILQLIYYPGEDIFNHDNDFIGFPEWLGFAIATIFLFIIETFVFFIKKLAIYVYNRKKVSTKTE
jgi:hypothetical protein